MLLKTRTAKNSKKHTEDCSKIQQKTQKFAKSSEKLPNYLYQNDSKLISKPSTRIKNILIWSIGIPKCYKNLNKKGI